MLPDVEVRTAVLTAARECGLQPQIADSLVIERVEQMDYPHARVDVTAVSAYGETIDRQRISVSLVYSELVIVELWLRTDKSGELLDHEAKVSTVEVQVSPAPPLIALVGAVIADRYSDVEF